MNKNTQEILKSFLEANPLPWLYWDEELQKFIMVVDNHLMQNYRACPQNFVYAHVLGLKHRNASNKPERVWFLEFGSVLHAALEYYYKHFKDANFDVDEFSTKYIVGLWFENKMDEFAEEKEYKSIGGLPGFVGLVIQYTRILSPENEHLRVLATEVSFGKGREVPLYGDNYFEAYLSGRIDVLVDDGFFICPMDHKTKAVFKGEIGLDHMIDEGPIGYIYALKTILPSFIPEDMVLKRDCSKILMNYISKAVTSDPKDRFKRIPIRKTSYQLEQYQKRMAHTCQELLSDMVALAFEKPVHRNTFNCNNWMRRQCSFFDICRQGSKEHELVTIQNGFIRAKLWDTQEVGQGD